MAPLKTRRAVRAAHTTIFVRLPMRFFSRDKRIDHFPEQQMAKLEAFRAVLDDKGVPEILRNHGHLRTSKQVESLAGSDDARVPLAAPPEPHQRVAETSR